jgi:CRP-like cAMP-binding protein
MAAGSQTTLDAFQTATAETRPPLPDRVAESTERQQQQLIERSKARAQTVALVVTHSCRCYPVASCELIVTRQQVI